MAFTHLKFPYYIHILKFKKPYDQSLKNIRSVQVNYETQISFPVNETPALKADNWGEG